MIDEDQIRAICARHAATIGMSGSGKTFTEKGLVEALLRAGRHTVIVDPLGAWWGLRSSKDGEGKGFPIVIFGGEHADVEIGQWDGPAVADIVVNQTVSCIIDLSKFRTGEDQRLFMEGFIGALRGKPKGVMNLVIDEADEFAPETVQDKVGNRLKNDMIWIAKRGRLSGFILHIITQRPADIAKSVLTQVQTLIVHQLIAPNDQKPAEDWLKGNGDKVVLKSVMDSLASLETGERWVYSPKGKILDRDFSPAITTFDSSRTPEPGEILTEVKTLAQIDVSAIQGALAKPPEAVTPAARSEELEVAHARIEDLEAAAVVEATHRMVIRGAAEEVQAAIGQASTSVASLLELLSRESYSPEPMTIAAAMVETGQKVEDMIAERERSLSTGAGFTNEAGTHVSARARPGISIPRITSTVGEMREAGPDDAVAAAFEEGEFQHWPKKARDLLAMLDQINPARVTWEQLATMIGGKPSGGTFNTAKRMLQSSKLIIQEGKFIRSAKRSPVGMTRGQAAALWRSVLPQEGRTRDMFDVLLAATNPMTKKEIADAIGIAPQGGNFSGSFAPLNQNELVEKDVNSAWRLVTKLPGER